MAEIKTQKTQASVADFLDAIDDETKRRDAKRIDELMREATGSAPQMWGPSIVGYGKGSYRTADGKEHNWMQIGFSPRKAALTLYGLIGSGDSADVLARLGKHSTGKGCLYIKKLADVDASVLRELAERAIGAKARKT